MQAIAIPAGDAAAEPCTDPEGARPLTPGLDLHDSWCPHWISAQQRAAQRTRVLQDAADYGIACDTNWPHVQASATGVHWANRVWLSADYYPGQWAEIPQQLPWEPDPEHGPSPAAEPEVADRRAPASRPRRLSWAPTPEPEPEPAVPAEPAPQPEPVPVGRGRVEAVQGWTAGRRTGGWTQEWVDAVGETDRSGFLWDPDDDSEARRLRVVSGWATDRQASGAGSRPPVPSPAHTTYDDNPERGGGWGHIPGDLSRARDAALRNTHWGVIDREVLSFIYKFQTSSSVAARFEDDGGFEETGSWRDAAVYDLVYGPADAA